MSDGKPHPDAFSSTIPLDSLQFYPTAVHCSFLLVQIGVRILLVLYNENDDGYGIIVDWRTGEQGKVSRNPGLFILPIDNYDSHGDLPTRPIKSRLRL